LASVTPASSRAAVCTAGETVQKLDVARTPRPHHECQLVDGYAGETPALLPLACSVPSFWTISASRRAPPCGPTPFTGKTSYNFSMNIFGWIILITLLAKFVLDVVSQWLNLRSLDPNVPRSFADVYDPQKYAQSQEYTKVTSRFHLIESAFHLAVLLAFWFFGGFDWLDRIVRSFGYGPVTSGLLYIGALAFAGAVLSLPFSLYSTFVIEERFGFNRSNLRMFLLDRVKFLALAIALGAPLLGFILWFFERTGNMAWVYSFIFATIFTMIVQFIAPRWLAPIFNKFTPLPDGELKEAISRYARSVNFQFRDIFVMDASKRSSKANAFFAGFGRNKRIALFDTLVQQETVPEVLAVLAHEIGHYQKHHVPIMITVSIAQTAVVFYLLSLFLKSIGLFEAFYMTQPSIYTGLVFFGLLYEPISSVLSLVFLGLSRKHEYQADRFAVRTLGEGRNLASGLKKLSLANLSNLTPHPLYVFLHYTHPPLLKRLEAIREEAERSSVVTPPAF
jgi:STE24 endopeptidase